MLGLILEPGGLSEAVELDHKEWSMFSNHGQPRNW